MEVAGQQKNQQSHLSGVNVSWGSKFLYLDDASWKFSCTECIFSNYPSETKIWMICSINVTKIHFTIKDPLLFLGVFIKGGNLQQSQLPSECDYFWEDLS